LPLTRGVVTGRAVLDREQFTSPICAQNPMSTQRVATAPDALVTTRYWPSH
jgi:hypothetical protein